MTPWSTSRTTASFYTALATPRTGSTSVIEARAARWQASCAMRRLPIPAQFTVLLPRERDHLYDAEHLNGRWIIRTNWKRAELPPDGCRGGARNPTAGTGAKYCRTATTRSSTASTCFNGFLAISERSGRSAQDSHQAPWRRRRLSSSHPMRPPTQRGWDRTPNSTPSWCATPIRHLTTPNSTYDYNVRTGSEDAAEARAGAGRLRSRQLRHRIRSGRPRATAGRCRCRSSIARAAQRDGSSPMLQIGYGAYGCVVLTRVSPSRACRCSIAASSYAIAHVRGGQELGRRWYDDGQLLNKKNTFTDFIDATRLPGSGRLRGSQSACSPSGGSAGGLLMGAIANMAPGDYSGHRRRRAVRRRGDDDARREHSADHERVRRVGQSEGEEVLRLHAVVLALRQRRARRTIRRCSSRPGLWDSQVQYFEPAKWVARLRARKTDSNPLLFRTTMEAGHGGKVRALPAIPGNRGENIRSCSTRLGIAK